MTQFRYRYCQYIPDLHNPEDKYDFAVAVSSDRDLWLVGVNMSTYVLSASHPVEEAVFADTFRIVWRRIQQLNAESGHEALDLLNNQSASNVMVSEIGEITSDRDTREQAMHMFGNIARTIHDHLDGGVGCPNEKHSRFAGCP